MAGTEATLRPCFLTTEGRSMAGLSRTPLGVSNNSRSLPSRSPRRSRSGLPLIVRSAYGEMILRPNNYDRPMPQVLRTRNIWGRWELIRELADFPYKAHEYQGPRGGCNLPDLRKPEHVRPVLLVRRIKVVSPPKQRKRVGGIRFALMFDSSSF